MLEQLIQLQNAVSHIEHLTRRTTPIIMSNKQRHQYIEHKHETTTKWTH